MSTLLHPSQKAWQAGLEKDDSSVIMSTQYRYKEVVRWDVFMSHLWRRSGFVNCFDSTSDANCPNNIQNSQGNAYEYMEMDDFKAGRNLQTLYKIQGVTKDSGGSPLEGVTVDLFRTSDDLKVDSVVSDAAGNYVLYTPFQSVPHYCVAFKSPNLAGSTVQSLTGS